MEAIITQNNIEKMFRAFDKNLRRKTFRTVLRQSSNILRKQAINNLKKYVKTVDKKDKWGNTLRKGIKIKYAKDLSYAKVHIMGNFKLKFFELGTNIRFNKSKGKIRLKKRRYTGNIKPTNFFTTAKQQTQQQVFDSIKKNMEDTIIKINNKYKK